MYFQVLLWPMVNNLQRKTLICCRNTFADARQNLGRNYKIVLRLASSGVLGSN
jgi:hypothetical protein